MFSVPLPAAPTRIPGIAGLVNFESLPVTITMPVELDSEPRMQVLLLTCPPASMFSVPLPDLPTRRAPAFVHNEFVPETVTVPVELGP